MRLFVAVTPSPSVVRRIAEELESVRSLSPRSKWVKSEGLHITLAFLGERPSEDAPKIGAALEAAIHDCAPFRLRFRGAGVFGRPNRPRVLWVGCEGQLDRLQSVYIQIGSALAPLGYTPDRPNLTAHVTVCRSADKAGDRALSACHERLTNLDFGESQIDAVELFESRLTPKGALYTVVHRAPFTRLAPMVVG